MEDLPLLQQFQKEFLPIIKTFFKQHSTNANLIGGIAPDIITKLQEFTLNGGKRLRPALFYYGYQCFSEKQLLEVLKASVACELMQSFLLIHDDIIDNANLRRGKKTIHQNFIKKHTASHYGKSMAILTGNIAGYLGLQALAKTKFNEKIKYRIMNAYTKICIDEGYGEALDLVTQPHATLTKNFIFNIYRYKTARYTTEFPLIAATILAGKDHTYITKMANIGSSLGIMFQIQDDILGMFGDTHILGKSILSDLAQGKKTLLLWKAWQESNTKQKKYLKKIYGNNAVTIDDLHKVQEIIIATGSLTYAKNTIKNLVNSIKKELNMLSLKPKGKMFILDIISYLMDRKM